MISPENYWNYIQNIFIGITAFSIPFLWYVYQEIDKDSGQNIKDELHKILSQEFYQIRLNYFRRLILYPAGFILILGLFVFPLFLNGFVVVLSICAAVYFILLTVIFEWIKGKTIKDLRTFLEKLEPSDPRMPTVFAEIFKKDPEEFERDFSITIIDVIKYFFDKVDVLIAENNFDQIQKPFNAFRRFVETNKKLNLWILLYNVFPKILEWQRLLWEKENELIKDKDAINAWATCSEALRNVDAIFKIIAERCLKEREAFIFFDRLKKHAQKHQTDSIDQSDGKKKYYLGYLFDSFIPLFFDEVADSPESFDVWQHNYFPPEWLVTKANLEQADNIPPRIFLNEFVQWAQRKILDGKEGYDKKLDEVARELFPSTDPPTWARLFSFFFASYSPDLPILSVIQRGWNFGFGSRIRSFSGSALESKEELEARMEAIRKTEEEIDLRNTYELAEALFGKKYSLENLRKYIKALEEMDTPQDEKDEQKRLRYIQIFKDMENFLIKNNEGAHGSTKIEPKS